MKVYVKVIVIVGERSSLLPLPTYVLYWYR